MTYFSFLLLEKKFIIVLSDKYIAYPIQIFPVTFAENQSDRNPPACNIINMANICISKNTSATIRRLGDRTLDCPPMVNSPKGKPHINNIVITNTTNNKRAPIIANIVSPPQGCTHIK